MPDQKEPEQPIEKKIEEVFKTPDVDDGPKKIEEKGEPFDGNFA